MKRFVLPIIAALLLCSCGSGGSDSSSVTEYFSDKRAMEASSVSSHDSSSAAEKSEREKEPSPCFMLILPIWVSVPRVQREDTEYHVC